MSDGLKDALKGCNVKSMYLDNKDIISPSSTVTLVSDAGDIVKVQLNTPKVELKEGTKHDGGKPILALVPASLDEAVGEILTMGAKKYAPNNWKKGIAYTRIVSSLKRHLNEFYKGNLIDNESKKPHLWHVACNVAFLIEFESKPEKYTKFNDLHNGNEE